MFKKSLRAWSDCEKFLLDKAVYDGIVFYSEGGTYAPYLRPIIDALGDQYQRSVYYLTSDIADPLLLNPPKHVLSFFTGKGVLRTHVFKKIKAKVFAMTMPDLNTFHIKRSPNVQHYTYFHHSLVSTHMVYREGAFDHFDSIMCVGNYHFDEVREWESLQGLIKKELFEHGSPPLDKLMLEASKLTKFKSDRNKPLNVLLAPSWGSEGIMETCADEIIEVLLRAGYCIRVRPHPRTRQLSSKVLSKLLIKFAHHQNFEFNEDISNHDALIKSDIMVSDWSGVAMEFAFGLLRPVVFVDVPRKVNNISYTKMTLQPLECSFRNQVGVVVSPKELYKLPEILDNLKINVEEKRRKIVKLRNNLFYNIGNSARVGAEILMSLVTRN